MKKNLTSFFAVLIAVTLLVSACGSGREVRSRLERNNSPAVPAADQDQLVSGNTAFAFDLYQAVRSDNDNLVYSPYSISLALAMTYGGARSETASQMADVLHYTLPGEQFHPAFNALDLNLAARPDQAAGVDEADRFDLTIANALWGQKDWAFLPEYLDLLATNYGAGMRLVDFEHATESARRQINNWVSDQTNGRIKDILAPGMLDPSTLLAVANAIYFKATWEHEFDANKTTDAPFYLLNGDSVTVDMMTMEFAENLAYATGDGWQAIALPYKGGLTEMVVIVPDAGNFETFASSLDSARYESILSALQPQHLTLRMPKFTFETSLNLGDTLIEMGMPDAFDQDLADFSGMDGSHLLYIDKVLHKAFNAVDEKGTEAAAATVVLMMPASLMMPGLELTIDRPFFYVLRDVPTGTVLFMGQVLDPR